MSHFSFSPSSTLSRYREEGAAGQFKRVENSAQSSFDHLGLRDHTNQYGPSHAAFSSWKKSGTPTSSQLQRTTFGAPTKVGSTARDAFYHDGSASSPAAPLGASLSRSRALAANAKPNPITGLNGYGIPDSEPSPPRKPYFQPQEAGYVPPPAGDAPGAFSATPPPATDAAAPAAPNAADSPTVYGKVRMSESEMNETWSALMRSGKMKPSAAQCMVTLPGNPVEPEPKPYNVHFGMNTIGLHPAASSRPAARSNKFTSDFRDPFL